MRDLFTKFRRDEDGATLAEYGVALIVAIIVGIGYVFLNLLKAPMRDWAMFVSGMAFSVAFLLMAETKFW